MYNEKIDVATFQKPKNKIKAFLFQIIRHPAFDVTIILFIVGNVVIMALDQDDLSPTDSDNLQTANYYFTAIFIFEALFKIFVLDFSVYIENSWNR